MSHHPRSQLLARRLVLAVEDAEVPRVGMDKLLEHGQASEIGMRGMRAKSAEHQPRFRYERLGFGVLELDEGCAEALDIDERLVEGQASLIHLSSLLMTVKGSK